MPSGEINNKAVSAVKWAAVGTVTKFGVQLAAQVVLARLLGPENYGLFAMGLVVLTLSNFLADFGFYRRAFHHLGPVHLWHHSAAVPHH